VDDIARLEVPALRNGDRLDGDEFERRDAALPEDGPKCELIDGEVYRGPPASNEHSYRQSLAQMLIGVYHAKTPGTRSGDDGTLRLGTKGRPRPDGLLFLLPEVGGRAKEDPDGFLQGPVELVIEVAYSSASFDLHRKKDAYERAGCLEYLVLLVESQVALWFELHEDRYRPIEPEVGIHKSRVFPGLWLDARALFAGDAARVLSTLEQGLATPAHADFVRTLAGR
jgi:Uma2 family endonuclease